MTLHEAIREVLKGAGHPLTPEEIARRIKRADLYRKKSDGLFPDVKQIRARVNQYPSLFQDIEGYILLVENQDWNHIMTTYWSLVNRLKGYYSISEIQFLVATLFYLIRKRDLKEYIFPDPTHYNSYPGIINHADFIGSDEFEERIISEYNDLVYKQQTHLFRELLRDVNDIDTLSFTDIEYGTIFNYLINLNSLDSHQSPIVYTPNSLKNLMAKLIYEPSLKKIYDPVAGTGGLLIEVMKLADEGIELEGTEINQWVTWLGYMNLRMHGSRDFHYNNRDCFIEYGYPRYDYIIGDLPMSGVLSDSSFSYLYREFGFIAPRSGKGFGPLVLFILSKLSGKGKAVITVSESFLFKKGGEKDVRQLLVDRDYIEAVISLPHGTLRPYTDAKAALLVINKNKSEELHQKIKFIEARKIDGNRKSIDLNVEEVIEAYTSGKETNVYIVPTGELIDKNNLQAGKYSTKNLLDGNEKKENKGAVLFDHLIQIRAGATIEKKEMSEDGILPVVKIENLSKDILDVYLNENQSFSRTKSTSKYQKFIVDKECILIARIGDNLKPTYFKPSDSLPRILIHTGTFALLPKEKEYPIDLEYLFYQLRTDYVKEQIQNRRQGAVMPFISMSALRETLIPYVDINSQKAFILSQKANIIAAERAKIEGKIKLLGVQEEKEQTESDIVRTLVHQLRPTLYGICSDVEKIKRIVNKHDLSDLRENLQQPEEDETDPLRTIPVPDYTLKEILMKVEHDSEKLSDILTTVNKVMTYRISPEDLQPVDLFELFKDYLREKQMQECGNLQIELTGESVILLLHVPSIKEMIDQLIINAKKHGFKDSILPPAKRKVSFRIRKIQSREVVVIEYQNNGKPFALTQEDFIRSFRKGQQSDGSGIGGNYIYRIAQAHKGDIQIKEQPKSGFQLTIEIPFILNNDENE